MSHQRKVRNRSVNAREAPKRIAKQTGPPGTPLRRSHRETRGAEGYKQRQPYRGMLKENLKFWKAQKAALREIDFSGRVQQMQAKASRNRPKS